MKQKKSYRKNQRKIIKTLLEDGKQSCHQIHICSNIMVRREGKNPFYLWMDEVKNVTVVGSRTLFTKLYSKQQCTFIKNVNGMLSVHTMRNEISIRALNVHWVPTIFSSIYQIKSREKSFTPSGFFLKSWYTLSRSRLNLCRFYRQWNAREMNRRWWTEKKKKWEKVKPNSKCVNHSKYLLNAPLCTGKKKALKPREQKRK